MQTGLRRMCVLLLLEPVSGTGWSRFDLSRHTQITAIGLPKFWDWNCRGDLFLEAARYRACASRTARDLSVLTLWAVVDRPYSGAAGVDCCSFQ